MIDPKHLDELAKKIIANCPPALKAFPTEFEKNVHAALQATFAKLDLVTREEFDIQVALLEKSREKLQALEKQLIALQKSKKD